MKLKLIPFIFLTTLLFLKCETSVEPTVDLDHFFKLYGSYHNDYILSVEEIPGAGILIAGYTSINKYTLAEENDENTYWPYICKINPDGMVDWDTLLDNTFENSAALHALPVDNGNRILCMYSNPVNNDSVKMILQYFDMNGIMEAPVSYYVNAKRILNARIVEQDDRNIKIVAEVERKPGTISEYYLLVFDYTGDSLSKSFDFAFSSTPIGLTQVKYYSEDQIIVGTTISEKNNGKTDIALISIKNKSVNWKEIISSIDGASLTCKDIKIIDNEIIVAGNQILDDIYKLLVVKVNPLNGKEKSRTVFTLDEEWNTPVCSAFTKNDSNDYVFTGYINTEASRSDIFFVEASDNGTIIGVNTFGTNGGNIGLNIGRSIHYLGNNDYLLTGEVEPMTNVDICLFKLNKEGKWVD